MKFPRNIFRDDFFRHTGLMIIGLQLVNVFNLVYHLFIVRWLSYEEYGTLNSLVIISLYFCQLTAPFQPALARFLAVAFARGEMESIRHVVKRASRDLGLFSLLVIAVFAIASGPLARQQNIDDPGYLLLVGILVAVSIMGAIPLAFLQGTQRFPALASVNALGALSKLVAGTALVLVGFKISGALAGFIASPLFIVTAGFILLGRYLSRDQRPPSGQRPPAMWPIYRYYVPTGLVLVSFTILTNADMTLVKKFFSPLDAGYYSVAQMVGKIILFLPGAVALVIFPKAASAQAQKTSSVPLLKKGLIVTALLCALGTSGCLIWPRLILRVLTGKSEPASAELVFWFATAMSFYALLWMTAFYNLSIRNTRFIKYLAAAAVLQTAVIYLHHPSLKSVLATVNIFAVAGFLVTVKTSRPAGDAGLPDQAPPNR